MMTRTISASLRTAAMTGILLAGGAGGAQAALIAHYSFDTTLTADSSGNGYNLTASGGPTQVAGQFGSAADFNGSSFLYLNGASNSAFNISTGDFALSFWYQSDSLESFSPLVGKNNSNSDLGYATTVAANLSGDLRDTAGGVVTAASPLDDMTVFHHIVFQRVGSNLEYYLDGVLASTAAVTSSADAGSNAFALATRNVSLSGGSFGGGMQMLDGRLDEVRVFSNALTATEITNLNEINAPVSEPTALALFGLGLVGLGFAGRRRRA